MTTRIIIGDVRRSLAASVKDSSVQCAVTSPPYFGLRDYGMDGQIGLEGSVRQYVDELVSVFRDVRRKLRDDGSLWLNLGDSFAREGGDMSTHQTDTGLRTGRTGKNKELYPPGNGRPPEGIKAKDMIGVPWTVALALRDDGWYLRRDVIWHKTNPMTESTKDRPTSAHEYLFLLSKSDRYFYDYENVKEPLADNSDLAYRIALRQRRALASKRYDTKAPYADNFPMSFADAGARNMRSVWSQSEDHAVWRFLIERAEADGDERMLEYLLDRFIEAEEAKQSKGDVWRVSSQKYKGAHFATYPPALIEPCVKASSGERACEICGAPFLTVVIEREDGAGRESGNKARKYRAEHGGNQDLSNSHQGFGFPWKPSVAKKTELQKTCECLAITGDGRSIVLDPFGGAGTTALVAERLGRDSIMCELNPEYAQKIPGRIFNDAKSTQLGLLEDNRHERLDVRIEKWEPSLEGSHRSPLAVDLTRETA